MASFVEMLLLGIEMIIRVHVMYLLICLFGGDFSRFVFLKISGKITLPAQKFLFMSERQRKIGQRDVSLLWILKVWLLLQDKSLLHLMSICLFSFCFAYKKHKEEKNSWRGLLQLFSLEPLLFFSSDFAISFSASFTGCYYIT